MATIRVVIADDHSMLRAGLRALLEERSEDEIVVVGEAPSGEAAIDLVEQHQPDVLLLDLAMPGLGGLGATIELVKRGSSVRVLIVTQYTEAIHLRRALEAGANGYITKGARGDELLSAIRSVASGGTYVDPTLAGDLVTSAYGKGAPPSSDEEALERLTPRERQVLRLVAEGLSSKEIASSLDISVKTVMAHRANTMDKLGIRNRSKLIQFGIRTGLVDIE